MLSHFNSSMHMPSISAYRFLSNALRRNYSTSAVCNTRLSTQLETQCSNSLNGEKPLHDCHSASVRIWKNRRCSLLKACNFRVQLPTIKAGNWRIGVNSSVASYHSLLSLVSCFLLNNSCHIKSSQIFSYIFIRFANKYSVFFP